MCAQSYLTLCDPMTVVCQAPLSTGFSGQEYRSGLPLHSPGDLPDPGSASPALAGRFFATVPPGSPVWPHTIWPPLSPGSRPCLLSATVLYLLHRFCKVNKAQVILPLWNHLPVTHNLLHLFHASRFHYILTKPRFIHSTSGFSQLRRINIHYYWINKTLLLLNLELLELPFWGMK